MPERTVKSTHGNQSEELERSSGALAQLETMQEVIGRVKEGNVTTKIITYSFMPQDEDAPQIPFLELVYRGGAGYNSRNAPISVVMDIRAEGEGFSLHEFGSEASAAHFAGAQDIAAYLESNLDELLEANIARHDTLYKEVCIPEFSVSVDVKRRFLSKHLYLHILNVCMGARDVQVYFNDSLVETAWKLDHAKSIDVDCGKVPDARTSTKVKVFMTDKFSRRFVAELPLDILYLGWTDLQAQRLDTV